MHGLMQFLKAKKIIIVGTLIVLFLSVAAILLIRHAAPVDSVQTDSTGDATSAASKRTTITEASGKTSSETEKLDTPNTLTFAVRERARSTTYLSFNYPDADSLNPDESISSTHFGNYAENITAEDTAEYANLINSILDRLQPIQAAKHPDNIKKTESVHISGKDFGLEIYKPESNKPTYLTMYIDNYPENPVYYTADHAAYEDICKIIAPYTFDAAKTLAEKFLKAFADKDIKTLKKLSYGDYDKEGLKWELLDQNGGTITDLKYEPIKLHTNYGIFNVSFNIVGDRCKPFKKGKNERVLAVGTYYDAVYLQVTSFVDKEKYQEPLSQASKQVEDLLYFYRHQFQSTAEIEKKAALQYILYALERMKYDNSETDPVFSQEDVDRSAKLFFNLNSLDGKDTEYFEKDKNSYRLLGFGLPPLNCRIYGETENNGAVYVTVEYFADYLQTLHERSMRYELAKNSDGTYRFVRAEALKQ